MPILTPEEYRKRANEIYDPGYQIKIANENNAYNDTLNGYNQQIGNVNTNFQTEVAGIQRNTQLSQNQYSNNNLSRGLGRSTIASTGIAGISNTGTRLEAEATQMKDQRVADLETLKTTLRTNLDRTLNALSAEKEGNIASMSEQLRQRDEDIQRQLDAQAEDKRRWDAQQATQAAQQAEDKRRWEAEFAFQQQQASKKTSGSSGSSGNSNKDTSTKVYKSAAADIEYILKNSRKEDAQLYIRDSKGSWLSSGMTSTQLKALQDYVDSYYYTPDENAQYRKKTYNQRPATEGL